MTTSWTQQLWADSTPVEGLGPVLGGNARIETVSVGEALLLVLAGIAAGLIGSIAGLASLFSYPALLAAGLSPVIANVTNTVALVFSSVGSVGASGPELRGRRAMLERLVISGAIGGILGGVLLLTTPADAFKRVVPWLIGLASAGRPDRAAPTPCS